MVKPPSQALVDAFGRVHTYLRLSVTDRCNFRCIYCLPAEGMPWMPREEILSFEEMARLVTVFSALGIRRVRITGGEPTLRKDLVDLVRLLSDLGLDEIALTTNGLKLESLAGPLAQAGLTRLNVSLDSLDEECFSELTRGASLTRVLRGIQAAWDAGLTPVKINAVLLRGKTMRRSCAWLSTSSHRPTRQNSASSSTCLSKPGGIKVCQQQKFESALVTIGVWNR